MPFIANFSSRKTNKTSHEKHEDLKAKKAMLVKSHELRKKRTMKKSMRI
jgi:hypothetical protein